MSFSHYWLFADQVLLSPGTRVKVVSAIECWTLPVITALGIILHCCMITTLARCCSHLFESYPNLIDCILGVLFVPICVLSASTWDSFVQDPNTSPLILLLL